MSEASPTTEQLERMKLVSDELETLGEAPPSEAELALLRELDLDLDDDPDVASVARLAELAEPFEFEDLSPLELHRSWRGVEHRLPAQPNPETQTDTKTTTGGGVKPWLFAAVGMAAAAAVLLLVLQPDSLKPGNDSQQVQAPTQEQIAEMVALGDQARAALRMLDNGQTDTERATQLAAAYQRRLEHPGEQDG